MQSTWESLVGRMEAVAPTSNHRICECRQQNNKTRFPRLRQRVVAALTSLHEAIQRGRYGSIVIADLVRARELQERNSPASAKENMLMLPLRLSTAGRVRPVVPAR